MGGCSATVRRYLLAAPKAMGRGMGDGGQVPPCFFVWFLFLGVAGRGGGGGGWGAIVASVCIILARREGFSTSRWTALISSPSKRREGKGSPSKEGKGREEERRGEERRVARVILRSHAPRPTLLELLQLHRCWPRSKIPDAAEPPMRMCFACVGITRSVAAARGSSHPAAPGLPSQGGPY